MNADALQGKGFREVLDGVFVRLKVNGKRVTGLAMWKRDGATMFAGARMEMRAARKLVLRLCRMASAAFPLSRRRRARKLLSALLAKNLAVAGYDDPEVGIVEDLIGLFSETEVGRRRRRKRGWFKKGLKKLRSGINKLSKKVAKNKVMQKLRNGYAKVMDGPVGDIAAKTAARALMAATGIPAPISEMAIRAHLRSQSSRMRDGGMAGVVHRATGRKGARGAARQEAKRFGRAAKRTGRDAASRLSAATREAMKRGRRAPGRSGGLGRSIDIGWIAHLARAGRIDELVDEVGAAQNGLGLRAAYTLGSCM